ncbi:MAG: hypothetical protein AAGF13_08095 [Pseudomonadota bacterium]
MSRFELRRACDGLVYRFKRCADGTFVREDNARMVIMRDPNWGWIAVEPDGGGVAGLSFAVATRLQGDAPPEGAWVSRKSAKSYVYELVHV